MPTLARIPAATSTASSCHNSNPFVCPPEAGQESVPGVLSRGGKRLGVSSRPSSCRDSRAQVQFSRRALCKLLPSACSVICRKSAALVKGTVPSAKGSTMYACAWTVSITARIAGKPATSRLPAAVVTEPKSFRVQIDADARLAAAVGGAARYLADAAGMGNGKAVQLQSSVVAACVEVFHYLTGDHPHLQVTLARFADRIEVALSHHGDASPAVGLDSIAGFDRVQHETHGGESVTRLTKYIGRIPSVN